MRQDRKNPRIPSELLTGQNAPKSNFFCQENLTENAKLVENRDTYSSLSQMGKIDKSALAGALMLSGAIIAEPALSEQSKLEQLTDPALTEQMIATSGFQIPDAGEGSIIGIPLGGGKFQIVGRFSMPPESVEGRSPVAGSAELMGTNGTCAVYRHHDPAKRLDAGEPFDAALYEPQRVCSYQIELSDDQIHQLAYGEARVNEFFPAINVNEAIPAVGGREITDPIAVSTYNLDPTINRELWLNTAKVWLACWDADASSDDVGSFDRPDQEAIEEFQSCSRAKEAASDKMGDVRVGVSEAGLEAATAELESVQRDRQTLSEILDILKRRE